MEEKGDSASGATRASVFTNNRKRKILDNGSTWSRRPKPCFSDSCTFKFTVSEDRRKKSFVGQRPCVCIKYWAFNYWRKSERGVLFIGYDFFGIGVGDQGRGFFGKCLEKMGFTNYRSCIEVESRTVNSVRVESFG